jgi:uncharacterized RDD family membrane protein YckC
MTGSSGAAPPGWYHAWGDPPGTQRYWDGRQWVGGPQWVGPPAHDAGGRPLPELGRTLADPGARIVARILDALLLGVVTGIPIAFVLASRDDVDFDSLQRWSILTVLVTAVYDITLIAVRGATVGKLALGIEVVRQDGTSPPGWPTAFLRHLVELIAILPSVFGLVNFMLTVISFIFLFTDERRRTINDRVASTYVVKARPKTPNW